ncbi:hypothetical protein BpHYR1_035045 [Brachionus plicatilis]|uniref:Uncharacterized protein n=1 Tax=Brachionus plicatilis TaxID=10195 RepID=A0A3M7SZ81_BRAPC|nr:hypothetical protein BpHYR1_035045 [Brachionus plicatilis]
MELGICHSKHGHILILNFVLMNYSSNKIAQYSESSKRHKQNFATNFKVMPPIYEEKETSPCYGRGANMVDYTESFDYYKDCVDQCAPCEPCYPNYCYDPCNPNYCYDPCTPNYCYDPCNQNNYCDTSNSCAYPRRRLKYEECFDCEVTPLYAKEEKCLPLAPDYPISLSNPCPPPQLCGPCVLPTIYRKYHNRIGNPEILAEYVDVLDNKCIPTRIFSREYREQEKVRQVGMCYTYKVKRKEASKKNYDKHEKWQPRKVKNSRSHLTRVEPQYADDINVRVRLPNY